MNFEDTICAISTPAGTGAIAVIRVSGKNTLSICSGLLHFRNSNILLKNAESHKAYLVSIEDNNEIIDESVLTFFHSPQSYTGEDVLEISCHGSYYIQQRILQLLISCGARMAKPGEFTLRAFINGKFDLSQAESVADLISSGSKSAHDLAIAQMRGGYSSKIKELRAQLLEFASLIELELDFSQEDVEFADRGKLNNLLFRLKDEIEDLIHSFSTGNVLKHGIPVAIVGKPNSGKSTLLNALLNEEKAIVSEIPGTTRDIIEDAIIINGIQFRFIDTAGLREAESEIESIGIEKTYEKIRLAKVILYVFDITYTDIEEIKEVIEDFRDHIDDDEKRFILVGNKTDLLIEAPKHFSDFVDMETIFISAKRKENIRLITESLIKTVQVKDMKDTATVSNLRHYEALIKTLHDIENVERGFLNNTPTDLIAIDIKSALHHLGSITGEVTTDEILGNIFSNFCIGK